MIPQKLFVPSDGNELEYKMKIKDGRNEILIYEYVKGDTNMGMRIRLTEFELKNYIKNGILKEN